MAGRSMPGSILKTNFAIAIRAPVLPAEMTASARPSATALMASRMLVLRPFLKAAVERCPVSLEKTQTMSVPQVYDWLQAMPAASIYDGNRLAQPDELANYLTGDGLEKAILLANVLRHRTPDRELHLEVDGAGVVLKADRDYEFASAKTLRGQVDISPEGEINAVARSYLAKS